MIKNKTYVQHRTETRIDWEIILSLSMNFFSPFEPEKKF